MINKLKAILIHLPCGNSPEDGSEKSGKSGKEDFPAAFVNDESEHYALWLGIPALLLLEARKVS